MEEVPHLPYPSTVGTGQPWEGQLWKRGYNVTSLAFEGLVDPEDASC